MALKERLWLNCPWPCMAFGCAMLQGFLVHRDAADALLCRARARLKLGDAVGARDDAAKARSLSGHLAASMACNIQ